MKSSKIILLIIVIALVIVGVGIWPGGLFMGDRTKDGQEESPAATKTEGDEKAGDKEEADAKDETAGKADPCAAEASDPCDPCAADPCDTAASDPCDPCAVEVPIDPNTIMEAVNLKDVEMKDIIPKLAEWTGKIIIPTDDAQKVKFTIYSPRKLPRARAVSLLYAYLYSKGFIVEEVDDIIYIKPLKDARLGRVPHLGPGEPLALIENKSQIVEKVFKLKNYSPSNLLEIVRPLIPEHGFIVAEENTKTLIVVDTVGNLLRIQQYIDQLDVFEGEQVLTEIFVIEHGDPVVITQVLRKLLQVDARGHSSRGARGKGSSSGKAGEPAVSVVVSAAEIAAVIIPEPRHKRIIVNASTEDMAKISQWIKSFDIPQQVDSAHEIITVKFVNVTELARYLTKALEHFPGSDVKANVSVQAMPDTRQIMIFGSPERRALARKLIAETDFPADKYETRFFAIEHADPEQIVQNINDLFNVDVNQGMPYWRRRPRDPAAERVTAIAYDTPKQVTVIATPEKMLQIAVQIEKWDQPINVDEVKPLIINLRNSDPVKMVKLLRNLFSDQGSGRSFWDLYFNTGGSDNNIGPLYGELTFEAVPDTTKIIVMSDIPAAYHVIKEFVNKLDREEKAELPMVITLKYADAEDLCEQLNAILNENSTTASVRRSQRGLSSYLTDDETGQRQPSGNNQANRPDEMSFWWNKARRNENQTPTSNLIGKIRFVPVHRSKAILVLCPQEYQESIRDIITQLDQPGKQVLIKAIIVEVNHDDMSSLGVRLASGAPGLNLAEDAIAALSQLAFVESFGNVTLAANLNANILVDLLVKEANARILIQPSLWTKDNAEADVFKGESVPFLTSEQTSAEGRTIINTVEYRPVGVTLRVRPNITPDRAVELTINLVISQLQPELINGNIVTNEMSTTTNFIVQDGQTIMISGMLSKSESKVVRKIPLLGDLPLLGGLFRHTETRYSNNELLAFITVYVLSEPHASPPLLMQELDEARQKLEEIREELEGPAAPEPQ